MVEGWPISTSSLSSIPTFLRPLRALSLAIVDRQGTLIDANQGFYELLPEDRSCNVQRSVRNLFINPTLEEFLARAGHQQEGVVYNGLMTLGNIDGESETWVGNIYCRDSSILVVCEPDVQQERNLRRQLLELTEQYAEKERELVRANRELTRYGNEVERLSLTDPLTELPNRRRFDDFMQKHIDLANRHGDSLVMMIIDLDRFKQINDRHGHQYGDQVLCDVAATLNGHVRTADTVARWGGEEFAVLAPKTDHATGLELAERLRLAVEARPGRDEGASVTVSIGVAEHQSNESAEEFIRRADAALYRAKDRGRNQVALAWTPD